jgi:hypothetical protein
VAGEPYETSVLKSDALAIWRGTFQKDTNTAMIANSDETFLSVSSVWAISAQIWVHQLIDGPGVNNDGKKEKISRILR